MTSNSAVGAYTYPATGNPRPHAVTAAGGNSYGYDSNGNMTSAAGDTLTYDGENRLTSVNTVLFVYGPDGERLKEISGGTTTLYLGGDIELTAGVYTKYLPGDAKRIGSTTYWLHRDHLAFVRLETSSTGAVVQQSNYRPYGDRLTSIATIPEAKGFIGERHDDETGLLYLHARYYDPVLARFIQADPSDPRLPGVDVNRYAYAGNSPTVFLDPTGLANGEARSNYSAEHNAGWSGNGSIYGGGGGTAGGSRSGGMVTGGSTEPKLHRQIAYTGDNPLSL